MATTTPPSDSVLAQAVELRVSGSTWESVAKQMHRSPETVRKWPARYADRWQPLQNAAERRLAADSEAESILVLRNLLRSSKDERIRRDCARYLIRLRLELACLDLKSPPATPPRPLTSNAVRLITFVDGLPDEEIIKLAANFEPLSLPAARVGSAERDLGTD